MIVNSLFFGGKKMQLGIFLYFSMYLSDQLLSSVLVFSPNLFLEGQMVFITENFDACLSKVVFYIGPNFLVQYKFGNHLWVWVECSICRNFHWLCRFIIETVLLSNAIIPLYSRDSEYILLTRNFLESMCQQQHEIRNLGSRIKFQKV